MKLFLISNDLETKHKDDFIDLLGKENPEKALVVTAAAVPYGQPSPEWVERSIGALNVLGTKKIDRTNLEEGSLVPEDLSVYDFVFLTGGNTFYLAYRLKVTGFGELLKKYIEEGGIFLGSSAGAIVLMDEIGPYSVADDPKKAPEIVKPLGLINYAFLPHADHEKYAPLIKGIGDEFEKMKKETFYVKDSQVLVQNGENIKII